MPQFRIGVGRISHETNSFSSVATDVDAFDFFGGVTVGPDILEACDHRDEMAGFTEALGAENVEIVLLLVAAAVPAGCWMPDAVKHIDATLREQLHRSGHLDGICIALHGAMSSAELPDLSGFFLESIREVLPDAPIVGALDFHAVVTQRMVDMTTAMVAYRTHPHVDLAETGARAARILLDTLTGAARPVMRYRKVPLLVPPPEDGTHGGALSIRSWDRRRRLRSVVDATGASAAPLR